MNKTIIAIAALGVITASTAFAAELDFSKADANGDGQVTNAESMQWDEKWTTATFKASDLDGNGTLSKEEFDTAMKKVVK